MKDCDSCLSLTADDDVHSQSTTNMATSSNYWEDLRKEARQLENELDLKLVSFSKLCTSYSSSNSREQRTRNSSSSQDNMLVAMTTELQQLLANLSAVNDKMAEYTSTPGVSSHNAALMHTLQRHRDILQDYTHEFHKTQSNFFSLREREDLLGSVHRDIESYKSSSGVNNRKTELFLKEHEHLRNSDSLIDNAISIAMATKENITFQRGMLKSIQTRVTTLASILFYHFSSLLTLYKNVNVHPYLNATINHMTTHKLSMSV
ncbi:Golgi SNAP receptor complex member 1-like [Solea senegalensis]|uniref:Golgi SNAP receptor complex member 1 n=1 Tax=Solea senegalensis TaxID=28829 RepID=A0AAV6SH41_SOLSE|nr:Golgi SNAP receptor complex member 1-like [Solea senegalensis]